MAAGAGEPPDFLAQLREREDCCREVMELLTEKSRSDWGRLWAHHLPLILDKIGFFRQLCQEEIEHFGEWRYHGFQPDEVIDFIDEDLAELTRWICRMTNTEMSPATEVES